MSDISVKCPNYGEDLVLRSSIEIQSKNDIDGTNCGRTIRNADIANQAKELADKFIRDFLRKHFK